MKPKDLSPAGTEQLTPRRATSLSVSETATGFVAPRCFVKAIFSPLSN